MWQVRFLLVVHPASQLVTALRPGRSKRKRGRFDPCTGHTLTFANVLVAGSGLCERSLSLHILYKSQCVVYVVSYLRQLRTQRGLSKALGAVPVRAARAGAVDAAKHAALIHNIT